MGGEIFVIDVTEANRLLDEQRRVIEEVTRRCHLKGKHYYCRGCPVWEGCSAKSIYEEDQRYAIQR
jgi:hypothetical protein